ncbi:hypothetical protein ZWY2020_005695, partial [Hordeum vulgare]
DNSDLNSDSKTPIIAVRSSVVSINSLDEATPSQPKKEEKNPSPPSTHENFSTGINENRSFIMISSSSIKDTVKCFQATPIVIQHVSTAILVFDERDASVQIQMPLEFSEQQG